MARPKRNGPSDQELVDLYEQYAGNVTAIARHLKRSRATVDHWYSKQLGMPGQGESGVGAGEKQSVKMQGKTFELPEFPDDKVDSNAIMDHLSSIFEKKHAAAKSRNWFDIKVNIDGPIGLTFVGDPHLGDNGCNYPLVRHHADLLRDTDGMYAVNIGDTANNWIGRLTKLYAEQDSSKKTERQLADWFLNEAGIDWMVWLMGNHDMWGEFSEILRGYNIKKIPMEDWQARFVLRFPNDRHCKIWAAHDFKGHSMWNTLHGPQKAAHMKGQGVHIFASGHTHNWACHQEEHGHNGEVYWLLRSRGYKYVDEYADLLGHFPQQEGASITAIINPDATSRAGFIQCFADMDLAADYLTWMRK